MPKKFCLKSRFQAICFGDFDSPLRAAGYYILAAVADSDGNSDDSEHIAVNNLVVKSKMQQGLLLLQKLDELEDKLMVWQELNLPKKNVNKYWFHEKNCKQMLVSRKNNLQNLEDKLIVWQELNLRSYVEMTKVALKDWGRPCWCGFTPNRNGAVIC